MSIFSKDDIAAMSQRYRVNFINSLSGFKSANLVGSVSTEQHSNLAIISSVFHLGADPALIGFINRPASVERHTLENILGVKHYTINHVNDKIIEQAHQTSARYPREQSEFAATGLTEYWADNINAPFVKESAIKLGIAYQEHHTLLNQTVMVIGEIIHVEIADEYIHNDGLVDIQSAGTVAVSGLDVYHQPKKIKRLAYAKPDIELKTID